MAEFSGKLRSNEIFGALFNMIISQQVFVDNISGTFSSLVDKAKVDGSLYGDSKLFYSTDVLKSFDWGNDGEASNLLALYRPKSPECQEIVLDNFRQIPLTVDYYLSKRAWGTPDAFMQFTSVMLGWVGETKKIYDATLYNTFIGNALSEANRASEEVDIESAIASETGVEAKNRITAQAIAEALENLVVDLKDVSRDFNGYQHLRSYSPEGLTVVWNSKWANKIKKTDMPTIFHKDGLLFKFENEVLPARYFGDIGEEDIALANNDGTKRSTIEADYATAVGEVPTHVFPGDLIPAKTALVTALNGTSQEATAKTITSGIASGDYYTVDENRIAIVMLNPSRVAPFMSAFEVATSFFNPKSLTENHYLTWGHNTLELLKDAVFTRLEAKTSSNRKVAKIK